MPDPIILAPHSALCSLQGAAQHVLPNYIGLDGKKTLLAWFWQGPYKRLILYGIDRLC